MILFFIAVSKYLDPRAEKSLVVLEIEKDPDVHNLICGGLRKVGIFTAPPKIWLVKSKIKVAQ